MRKLYSSAAGQPRLPIYAWHCFFSRRLGTKCILVLPPIIDLLRASARGNFVFSDHPITRDHQITRSLLIRAHPRWSAVSASGFPMSRSPPRLRVSALRGEILLFSITQIFSDQCYQCESVV